MRLGQNDDDGKGGIWSDRQGLSKSLFFLLRSLDPFGMEGETRREFWEKRVEGLKVVSRGEKWIVLGQF